ncbi:MAG TPA: hypothetical protein P5342_00180 [Candidatus Cloacimonadota bacterium]|nr:hypothetical protein [Candidatus Cloacimonadota bacterium]
MQCRDNRIFVDYRIPLRLISSLDAEGSLKEQAVQSILGIISDIKRRFPEMQKIIVVGTEALRRAKNAPKLKEMIVQQTGQELYILSEEQEARAAFKGITSALNPSGSILAFDIGGASTELIYGNGEDIEHCESLPMGAVSLNDQFRTSDPYTNCAFHALELHVEKFLKVLPGKSYTLIGTGGSISTMAAVAAGMQVFDAEALNGSVLSRAEIFRQVLLYRSYKTPQICEIPGMDPARADLMLAATMLVCQIIHKANTDKLTVSTRGVRHGIICARRSGTPL